MNIKDKIEEILNTSEFTKNRGKCPCCNYQCKTRGITNGLVKHLLVHHPEKYHSRTQRLLALFNSKNQLLIEEIKKEMGEPFVDFTGNNNQKAYKLGFYEGHKSGLQKAEGILLDEKKEFK